ncbi:MAG TPA: response regulator [Phototrophicaceae bacterium]|jgi:two-component system cell cycle response regulator DivK|nr:response regulator [Phototrophicaceae bacterium]
MARTIVYIEDNMLNMRLIRRMLSSEDYVVLEAATGLSGLQLIQENRPDLILMDMNLPDIDGTEVASRIKSDIKLAHIPIVALTANAMHGDRERILAAGCDGYIAKPVSRTELLNTISYFLEQHPSGEKTNEDEPS